jgi:hypothetical protein
MSIIPAPTAPSTPAIQPTLPQVPPRVWNPLAALLSYLVPGLGQISQGRVGKGVLFFVCIYALFFYGTALGSGTAKDGKTEYRITSPVYLPYSIDPDQKNDRNNPWNLPSVLANLYNRPQFAAQFWVGIAAWPAVWQYMECDPKNPEATDTIFGSYQQAPGPETNNAVQTRVGRNIELGWVLTVIAGVLNILVIYDALAGPAFLPVPAGTPKAT